MKRIDELGISPWPWSAPKGRVLWVRDNNGRPVCVGISLRGNYEPVSRNVRPAPPEEEPNTNLFAAAPDMYEALWDLLFGDNGTANCRICKGAELGNCKTCHLGNARAALKLAGGERYV